MLQLPWSFSVQERQPECSFPQQSSTLLQTGCVRVVCLQQTTCTPVVVHAKWCGCLNVRCNSSSILLLLRQPDCFYRQHRSSLHDLINLLAPKDDKDDTGYHGQVCIGTNPRATDHHQAASFSNDEESFTLKALHTVIYQKQHSASKLSLWHSSGNAQVGQHTSKTDICLQQAQNAPRQLFESSSCSHKQNY